jgi:hypothetical protein
MLKKIFAVCFLLALLSPPAFAETLKWALASGNSYVTFKQGAGPEMPVSSFDSAVIFDPTELPTSSIMIRTGIYAAFMPPQFLESEDNKRAMVMAANARQTGSADSSAVFTSSSIRRENANNFVATGMLMINGKTKPVDVPFSVTFNKGADDVPGMVMKGFYVFNTQDFADGKFPDSRQTVTVNFDLAEAPLM